jgi:RNA-binding protein YlmH
VEVAERAADSWQAAVTDFQPPPVVAFASAAVAQLAGVGCVVWGGYPQVTLLFATDVLLMR